MKLRKTYNNYMARTWRAETKLHLFSIPDQSSANSRCSRGSNRHHRGNRISSTSLKSAALFSVISAWRRQQIRRGYTTCQQGDKPQWERGQMPIVSGSEKRPSNGKSDRASVVALRVDSKTHATHKPLTGRYAWNWWWGTWWEGRGEVGWAQTLQHQPRLRRRSCAWCVFFGGDYREPDGEPVIYTLWIFCELLKGSSGKCSVSLGSISRDILKPPRLENSFFHRRRGLYFWNVKKGSSLTWCFLLTLHFVVCFRGFFSAKDASKANVSSSQTTSQCLNKSPSLSLSASSFMCIKCLNREVYMMTKKMVRQKTEDPLITLHIFVLNKFLTLTN